MDSIEGMSVSVDEYYLLKALAAGEKAPDTEPKLSQMEHLLVRGLLRREGEVIKVTPEGHEMVRGSYFCAETGCYHNRVREIGRIPR